ncbi:amine oxidase [Bacillus salacetis]|uniref:Amine oxidase n=1 Tax=Bacillus salacetis TaxID=2315464 RepID=A0A3A1QUD9_9BACI|nr:FAD-dependent oxidoreductase [Bacillus salacetis]RIW31328.1 amine oxidase [Bacillus salacetis]
MKDPIIIIGAGVSGLHTASLLISKGIECRVLEARDRTGGRVLSTEVKDRPEIGRFDLGPTWFWPEHEPVISTIVRELGLETIEQHTQGAVLLEQSKQGPAQRHLLPEGAIVRSVRLAGGIQSLTEAILATLPEDLIQLDTRVKAVSMDDDGVLTVKAEHSNGEKEIIRAGAIIFALPPRIAAEQIDFAPVLPEELLASLKNKPTWMAGQAKVLAVYERPFWREEGLSGQVMSWTGPLQEIHDASPENGYGALFGFFGMPAKERQALGEDKVRALAVSQLERLFGPSAAEPISLLYKDWSIDAETAVESDLQPLTSFPAYDEPVNTGIWGKKIIFAGTETSPEFGGHLEGALRSAERAVDEILR